MPFNTFMILVYGATTSGSKNKGNTVAKLTCAFMILVYVATT